MALVSVTDAAFVAFLAQYKYVVAGDRVGPLALSFVVLQSLPWCDAKQEQTETITLAQCFIAYAMSAEGGGFNPAEVQDTRTVTREEIGRQALVDTYKVNDELIGTDPVSLLKRIPMAYGLLNDLLCDGVDAANDSGTHKASVFVV